VAQQHKGKTKRPSAAALASRNAVAVGPFSDDSQAGDQDYFCKGRISSLCPSSLVVAFQPRPQPPGLHATNRAVMGVERIGVSEDLRSNDEFFEVIRSSNRSLMHNEVQETLEPMRPERTSGCRELDSNAQGSLRANRLLAVRWRISST
jgi:hypothetical protein